MPWAGLDGTAGLAVDLAPHARRRQLGRPARLPPMLTARALAGTAGLPPDDELIGLEA